MSTLERKVILDTSRDLRAGRNQSIYILFHGDGQGYDCEQCQKEKLVFLKSFATPRVLSRQLALVSQ